VVIVIDTRVKRSDSGAAKPRRRWSNGIVTAPVHSQPNRTHRPAPHPADYSLPADVRHRDADRRYYLERYYQKDTNEPCLYDLQINTATIPLASGVRMIISLVRSEAAPA
jgi:cytidylate kinase